MRWTCLKACLVILAAAVINRGWADEEGEEFIATSEWQEVKPGQAIPAGLHVKMDLTNGGKWAKLMDDKDTEVKSLVLAENTDKKHEVEPEKGKIKTQLQIDELKEALKKMKDGKQSEISEAEKKNIKQKFRSMDEIKSAFDELNLNQESDFDAMTRLLNRYKNIETAHEDKLAALQDLENYVHQVDNAVDFCKLDGISVMVQALNNTEPDIRLEAAHVIGSAVQSNPEVQVKAVEAGALPPLIRIIADEKQQTEVRKKALYATSCLIRHFPAAQFLFKNSGGFHALQNCLNERGMEKLHIKAFSLINDLAVERKEHFTSDSKTDDHGQERTRQYKLFSLSSVIEELGLCDDLARIMSTESHDLRDMLLSVVRNLHGVCKSAIDYSTKVSNALERYKTEYKDLAQSEEQQGDNDSFFHLMHKTVMDLIKHMKSDNTGIMHLEL